MALILAESFEQYAGDESLMLDGVWSSRNSSSALSTTDGARTGTYFYNTAGGGGASQLRLNFNSTTLTSFGFAQGVRWPSLPDQSGEAGVTFRTAAAASIVSVVVNPAGFVEVRSGSVSGSILQTSTTAIGAGTWYHLEIQVVVSETVGSCQVRLNGQSILSVTGQNFGSTAAAEVLYNGGGTNPSWHIDDLVLYDFTGTVANDWLGAVRVQTIYPEADEGTPAEWSINGGGGDGAAAIDEEPPDDDTSYIVAANPTDQHRMSLPSLPSEVDTIYGIFTMARAKQEAAGSSAFKVTIISDGNAQDGAEHAITTDYSYWQDAFTLDPDGDVQWTKAQLEAALIQFERTV